MFFSYTEKVRFLDMNAGRHLSNDKILAYLTECTDNFLRSIGHHIGDFFGTALIFSEINVKYIREVRYPNSITIQMVVDQITESRILFSYKCYDDLNQLTHVAKMKCALFSLQEQKIMDINQKVIGVLEAYRI